MMVPRSYTYSSPPSSPKSRYAEKDLPSVTAVECAGMKAGPKKETSKIQQTSRLPGVLSPLPPTPSKPVIIPTRTRHDGRQKSKDQIPAERRSVPDANREHDQASTSPSVAALLAMTSIPIPKRLSHLSGQRRGLDIRYDNKRRAQGQGPRRALSSSSPQTWDFLLKPPDEEVQGGSFSSDTTIGPLSSVRSVSTESMPSLDEDEDSVCSASDPVTPATVASSRGERKRGLSTSKGKDCVFDHPLLPAPVRSVDDVLEQPTIEIGTSDSRPSGTRASTSFKSNLTASFHAVRFAARSLSEWTSPSSNLNRDDHLSRSLLSLTLPYTVERRPLPSDEPPDPALRRYLNPVTLSPAELYFHEATKDIDIKACIQLETYQRGNRPSQHASSPPIFNSKKQPLQRDALDTEDLSTSSLSPRQREPRENSAFLRVIVLEMNMRKVGKLPGSNPGRAKLWLPARRVGSKSAEGVDEGHAEALAFRGGAALSGIKSAPSKKIPARWASMTV